MNSEIIILGAMALGLAALMLWEIWRWSRFPEAVRPGQKKVRLLVVGLLLCTLVLLGGASLGYARTAVAQLVVLVGSLSLLVAAMALAFRDWRRTVAAHLETEMRIYGELARLLAAELKRKKQTADPEGTDGAGGREK